MVMPLASQGRSASAAHTRAGGGCCVPPRCSTALVGAGAGAADADAVLGADVGVDAGREEAVAVGVVATEASVATRRAAHDALVVRGSRCC
jgi:hypothetical protein